MEKTETDKIAGWFGGRLPDGWFTGAPTVTVEEKQILVVGTVSEPNLGADASAETRAGAEAGRIARFREGTRGWRIEIAREAERQFKLPVTWGATSGGTTTTFTPGGSGWRHEGGGEGEDEAKKVMIAARRRALQAWRRRFAFGGPPAWRRGAWGVPGTWRRGPGSGGDVQNF
jgi:hypothetical protein